MLHDQNKLRSAQLGMLALSTTVLMLAGMTATKIGGWQLMPSAYGVTSAFGDCGATGTTGASGPLGLKTIDGAPLNVCIGDRGNLQARLDTSSQNTFYESDDLFGDGGLALVFPQLDKVFSRPNSLGYIDGLFSAISQSEPTGSTGAISQTTVFGASGATGEIARVTQVVTYTQGDTKFRADYTVVNKTAGPLRLRAVQAADLFLEGSDSGRGVIDPSSPRIVGGVNPANGRGGGIEEVTPWSRYQVAGYSTIWSRQGDALGAGFDNTINSSMIDNGVGVQWDTHYLAGDALAPGATASYSAVWKFSIPGALVLDPASKTKLTGQSHLINVSAFVEGASSGGRPIRYTVTGANPSTGTVTTSSLGTASISYTGLSAGTDTIVAYIDLDNDSVRDLEERQSLAQVTWQLPTTTPAPLPVPEPEPEPMPAETPVVAPDTKPPVVNTNTLAFARIELAKKGLPVSTSCDEACEIVWTLGATTRKKTKGRIKTVRYVLGRNSAKLDAAGVVRGSIMLSKKSIKKLRKLRKAKFTILTSAKDPSGNTATAVLKLLMPKK